MIVRNLSKSAQSVSITIEYPGTDGPEQSILSPFSLGPYSTQDISLDSVTGQLPFCSIRIQYSGASGSAMAEVSSVEENRDLVIDSKLANEGDSLTSSGAYPWHLDDETESTLFLTNMGDKPSRIGFQVQANGVHYYLTKLRLNPHETRAIDLRKLRDAHEPDFQKNTIPANATDGSVLWSKFENVPVMGRMMVVQRHKGIASSYSCSFGCQCGPVLSFIRVTVSPPTVTGIPGDTQQFLCIEEKHDCHGTAFFFDISSIAQWLSSDATVATIDSTGFATAVGAGSANLTGQFTDTEYYWDDSHGNCVETQRTRSATARCNVYTRVQHNYPRNPLPAPCWISSFFDAVRNAQAHHAEDVVYDNGQGTGGVTPAYGTAVYAMEAGKVVAAPGNYGPAPEGYPACTAPGGTHAGNYVKIVASNDCPGSSGDNYSTIYFHVKPSDNLNGQCVAAGQQIGTLDNSGCQSGRTPTWRARTLAASRSTLRCPVPTQLPQCFSMDWLMTMFPTTSNKRPGAVLSCAAPSSGKGGHLPMSRSFRTAPMVGLALILANVSRGQKEALLRIPLLLAAGLLPFSLLIDATAEEASVKVLVSNNRLATCYVEQTGGFAGPMLVRSQVLVAPDGEHRGYTESLAGGGVKLPSATGGWLSPECANITKLFVASKREQEFKQALTVTPTEYTLGNAIRLVDWSPDSRYLLFELFLFQWGSDFGGRDLVLYDAQSGSSSDPQRPYEAFKKWAGRGCSATIEPLGFSGEGKVVLKVWPSYPIAPESNEPVTESDSCLKKPGIWLYDPGTGSLRELPDSYKVEHFGRFERGSPQKRS